MCKVLNKVAQGSPQRLGRLSSEQLKKRSLSDCATEGSYLLPADRQGVPDLPASKEGEDNVMHNQQAG